ncbi:MAG: creatininase family protein [Mucinivorans sp.]
MDFSKTTLGLVGQKSFPLVILPWGAIEPHNGHLPYITDALLSQAVALDAVALSGREVAVLPPIYLGQQNPTQYDYPLCIHTRQSTQRAILEDIVLSLRHQGTRKLLIINGHGGNSFKGIIRDLAFEYPDFMILSTEWFSIVPYLGFFEEVGDHADEVETSVMMHYYPELVHMDFAGAGVVKANKIQSLNEKIAWVPRNWKQTTDDTGIGNPLHSTPEKGRAYVEAVANKLSQLIRELC